MGDCFSPFGRRYRPCAASLETEAARRVDGKIERPRDGELSVCLAVQGSFGAISVDWSGGDNSACSAGGKQHFSSHCRQMSADGSSSAKGTVPRECQIRLTFT